MATRKKPAKTKATPTVAELEKTIRGMKKLHARQRKKATEEETYLREQVAEARLLRMEAQREARVEHKRVVELCEARALAAHDLIAVRAEAAQRRASYGRIVKEVHRRNESRAAHDPLFRRVLAEHREQNGQIRVSFLQGFKPEEIEHAYQCAEELSGLVSSNGCDEDSGPKVRGVWSISTDVALAS